MNIFKARQARIQKIRAENGWGYLIKYYRSRPWQIISDFGITSDPRLASSGKSVILPFILFPQQVEFCKWIMDCYSRKLPGVAAKSRDVGASCTAMALASALCILNDNITIGVGSRKEEYIDGSNDDKTLLYKVRQFVEGLPKELRAGYSGETSRYKKIYFPATNSRIIGESGSQIGRGARASLYFVDESAFLSEPLKVEASLSQTTDCRIDMSTFCGLNNPFARKYYDNKIPTFSFHWTHDPRKDQAWYDKQCRILDPITLATEVDMNPRESLENTLIPMAWIQESIDLHKRHPIEDGEVTAGLDLADTGVDVNALIFRRGHIIYNLLYWHGSQTLDLYGTAEKVLRNCYEVKKIIYDSDGLGASFRGDWRNLDDSGYAKPKISAFHANSELYNKNGYITEHHKNKDFFSNFKAQSWWRLRSHFEASYRLAKHSEKTNIAPISIDKNMKNINKLIDELTQVQYNKGVNGKVVIDKVPAGAKSPNLADACMMCFSRHKTNFFEVDWQ